MIANWRPRPLINLPPQPSLLINVAFVIGNRLSQDIRFLCIKPLSDSFFPQPPNYLLLDSFTFSCPLFFPCSRLTCPCSAFPRSVPRSQPRIYRLRRMFVSAFITFALFTAPFASAIPSMKSRDNASGLAPPDHLPTNCSLMGAAINFPSNQTTLTTPYGAPEIVAIGDGVQVHDSLCLCLYSY
jgi:hypothetical protein